jgi:hypothetical protein
VVEERIWDILTGTGAMNRWMGKGWDYRSGTGADYRSGTGADIGWMGKGGSGGSGWDYGSGIGADYRSGGSGWDYRSGIKVGFWWIIGAG